MPNNNSNKFYTFAKIALLERNWTVKFLAAKIGYPRRTVSAAINGANYPYVIQAIATELKYDTKANGPLPSSPARSEQRIRLCK